MVRVQVEYVAPVSSVTGKKGETVDVPGSTLRDLVVFLSNRYGPRFRNMVIKKDCMAGGIQILINHQNAGLFEGLSARLRDGDTVLFLPALAGG